MGLADSNGVDATMLVGPTSAPYSQGGGFGNGFGGDGWWILLLFLLLGNNGWGGGFGGFGGGSGELYPWMNQSNQINSGFRDQMINDNVTEIRSGVTGLSNQLCNCCSDISMALANGFAGVEQGANARQMANMQQAFGAQTAVTAGMNDIAMNLQNCCCENRANVADLKYTVATENCADRAALSDGLRDLTTVGTANTQAILNAINTGIQAIKDDLCNDRLDAVKTENANLRTQLNLASLAASQIDQTAQIRAGMANQVDALYNRLATCPIGTMPVYGSQPIFTCGQNTGCGCNN